MSNVDLPSLPTNILQKIWELFVELTLNADVFVKNAALPLNNLHGVQY